MTYHVSSGTVKPCSTQLKRARGLWNEFYSLPVGGVDDDGQYESDD